MAPGSADDDVTLREIGRTLADFRAEVRGQLAQLVRTDVYRAEQTTLMTRIVALEEARKTDDGDRAAGRRNVQVAFVSAIASPVAALLVSLLVASLHK